MISVSSMLKIQRSKYADASFRLFGSTSGEIRSSISFTLYSDRFCHVSSREYLSTAFRFVPIFATEFHDIQDAQKARGVDFDTKNIFRKIGLIAPLCVPLLMSSLKKVDVSAMSAEMRGFELRGYKSGYKEYPFAVRDLLTVVVLVALIAITALWGA